MSESDVKKTLFEVENSLPNTTDLGVKPDILLGCNTDELLFVLGFSLIPGILGMIITAIFLGIVFSMVTFFLFWIISCWYFTKQIRKAKRQKPRGFYMQNINIKLAKLAKGSYPFILEKKSWTTARMIREKNGQ